MASAASEDVDGRVIVNSAYSPNTVSTDRSPPKRRATSAANGSPNPAPNAPSRVEKNGLNMWVTTSSAIPGPLSRTFMSTVLSTKRVETDSTGR